MDAGKFRFAVQGSGMKPQATIAGAVTLFLADTRKAGGKIPPHVEVCGYRKTEQGVWEAGPSTLTVPTGVRGE